MICHSQGGLRSLSASSWLYNRYKQDQSTLTNHRTWKQQWQSSEKIFACTIFLPVLFPNGITNCNHYFGKIISLGKKSMFVCLLQAVNHIQVWQSDVSFLGDQDHNDIIFGWGWFGQSSHKTTTCKIVWQIFRCIALYFLPVAKQHPPVCVRTQGSQV